MDKDNKVVVSGLGWWSLDAIMKRLHVMDGLMDTGDSIGQNGMAGEPIKSCDRVEENVPSRKSLDHCPEEELQKWNKEKENVLISGLKDKSQEWNTQQQNKDVLNESPSVPLVEMTSQKSEADRKNAKTQANAKNMDKRVTVDSLMYINNAMLPLSNNGINEQAINLKDLKGTANTNVIADLIENCESEVERTVRPNSEARWAQIGTLLVYTSKGVESRTKIAAFDIDGTIICKPSDYTAPIKPTDWRFLFTTIPDIINYVFAAGYKVVFFTNQAGIGKGKVTVRDYKAKLESIVAAIGAPVQVFISTRCDEFVKPRLGMLKYLLEKENDNIGMNAGQSYFVGDAAGRPDNWGPGKLKDTYCSDRLFAMNAGIAFYTPEEYFLGEKKAIFNMPSFEPKKLRPGIPLTIPESATIASPNKEVIVMVGYPACGKSTFVKEHLLPHGYIHVGGENLYCKSKGVEACGKALKKGKSVVIDNINPSMASRLSYLLCAQNAGVPCRCFLFTATKDHAKHNDKFREITEKSHPPMMSSVVIKAYSSQYQEPTLREGFSEIVRINFVPKFKDEKLAAQYRMFYYG